MKPFFEKELVERERLKPYYENKKEKFDFSLNQGWNEEFDSDYDNFNRSLRSDHIKNHNGKRLNENLNPLYNFLKSSVGRNFDKVYSELRKNINANSAVQLHILEHLKYYVVRDPVKIQKELNQTYSYGKPVFYVDKHGNLQQFEHKKFKSKKPKVPDNIILGKAIHNLIWLNRYHKQVFEEGKNNIVINNNVPLYFCCSRGIWYKLIWQQLFDDFPNYSSWKTGIFHKDSSYQAKDFYHTMKLWKSSWKTVSNHFPIINNSKFEPRFISVSSKELKLIKKIISLRNE